MEGSRFPRYIYLRSERHYPTMGRDRWDTRESRAFYRWWSRILRRRTGMFVSRVPHGDLLDAFVIAEQELNDEHIYSEHGQGTGRRTPLRERGLPDAAGQSQHAGS